MGILLLDGSVARVTPQSQASPFADRIAALDRRAMELLGGEQVIYQPAIGEPVAVTGIFDERYLLVQGSADAGVEALVPAVFLRLEDLPTDPEQDKPMLIIRLRVYRVIERRPDDVGGIVLALRLVP